jgi:hypothetical protein
MHFSGGWKYAHYSYATGGEVPCMYVADTCGTGLYLQCNSRFKINSRVRNYATVYAVTDDVAEISAAGAVPSNQDLFIANHATERVVISLPSSLYEGRKIMLVGKGAAGWQITQNEGDVIKIGTQTTTVGTGGSIASGSQYDSIELVNVAAGVWVATSVTGTLTVV